MIDNRAFKAQLKVSSTEAHQAWSLHGNNISVITHSLETPARMRTPLECT
jgi:hypothetical protein